jgi:hypothetical protein
MKWLMCLLVVSGFTAFAADVTGTWKATIESPNGPLEITFRFKVDGEKLTGTVANQLTGESAVVDGQVNGDDLSFAVNVSFNGNDLKLLYKGKVSGEDIKLTVTVPGQDRTFEMTAKRVNDSAGGSVKK